MIIKGCRHIHSVESYTVFRKILTAVHLVLTLNSISIFCTYRLMLSIGCRFAGRERTYYLLKFAKVLGAFLSFFAAWATVGFLGILCRIRLLLRTGQFDAFFLWLSSGSRLLGLVGRSTVLAQRRINHLVVLGDGRAQVQLVDLWIKIENQSTTSPAITYPW